MSKPLTPPNTADLLVALFEGASAEDSSEKLQALIQAGRAEKAYRHWDVISHMPPPDGLTHKEWWLGIKVVRQGDRRELPLKDPVGSFFTYGVPDLALELLHYIDQHAGGEVAMDEAVVEDDAAKSQYLVNSLMEEAIRSSQLEGAVTSRAEAKEMIRSGRPARDRSEQMILNNYRALEFMRDDVGDELNPDVVLRLHRVLTEGTLDDPDAAGRLQRPGDVRVKVWLADTVLHDPPPAEQLPARLEDMCRFANGETGPEGFLHPVLRAVLLHFWLAYDHPFEDGNGRTARALFYWSMRTQGYWATEYLSISRILRERPSKYRKSFLYTETDERDTTYFLLDQLGVIRRAIDEFHSYIQRKIREVRAFDSAARNLDGLNHRQLELLRNAARSPIQQYTVRSHQRSHRTSLESARGDLNRLHRRGFLDRRKVGKKFVFYPVADLAQRLAAPPS